MEDADATQRTAQSLVPRALTARARSPCCSNTRPATKTVSAFTARRSAAHLPGLSPAPMACQGRRPIYGCGWNTYTTPDQKPEDPVDSKRTPGVSLLDRVVCPRSNARCSSSTRPRTSMVRWTVVLHDGYACLDYQTAGIHAEVQPSYRPEGQDLPSWMDWHLKDIGGPWPATPAIRFEGGRAVPRIVVTPDRMAEVQAVEIDYALNAPYSGCRFWRMAESLCKDDGIGRPTRRSPHERHALSFANVTYKSGVTSVSPHRTSRQGIAGHRSDAHVAITNRCHGDRTQVVLRACVYGPLHYSSYFQSWEAPDGTQCFTLNPAMWQDHEIQVLWPLCAQRSTVSRPAGWPAAARLLGRSSLNKVGRQDCRKRMPSRAAANSASRSTAALPRQAGVRSRSAATS